jgi:RNA-binding protein YhbY
MDVLDAVGFSVFVGNGVLVAVGFSVFVGNGVLVAVGFSVLVGNGVLVAVGFSVFVGNGVLVAVACDPNRLVLVGPMGVREGVIVDVRNAVEVTEGVKVKSGVDVIVDVGTMGEIVAVKKSLANSACVWTLSVLSVGVGEFSPVFGMTKSGSCRSSLAPPPAMIIGRPIPMMQAPRITTATI